MATDGHCTRSLTGKHLPLVHISASREHFPFQRCVHDLEGTGRKISRGWGGRSRGDRVEDLWKMSLHELNIRPVRTTRLVRAPYSINNACFCNSTAASVTTSCLICGYENVPRHHEYRGRLSTQKIAIRQKPIQRNLPSCHHGIV